jgi:hypothetical protein
MLASPDLRHRANALETTRNTLCASLAAEPVRSVAAALDRRSLDDLRCAAMLRPVDEAPASHAAVRMLTSEIGGDSPDRPIVAQTLLIRAALSCFGELQASSLPDPVVGRFCDEFTFIATADSTNSRHFEIGSSRFTRACKLVTLRRFPAGQFEWERSGIARRDVLRVRPVSMPSAIRAVLFGMRGLRPVFFSHLNPRRANRSLDERESNCSYYLMALAMERDPEVRGFAACSWFRAPATHVVSPHLAWLSRVIVDNGGTVVDTGRADPDCGVFYRSATRRRLYEEGRFTPTLGLVLWPRRAMIAWARAHPEFAP